jgi:hypothetical protein
MAIDLEPTSTEDDVEFLSSEGLAQPDAFFEEEFSLISNHPEIVGGSSGLCNCYSGSWVPFSPEEVENPIAETPSAVTAER